MFDPGKKHTNPMVKDKTNEEFTYTRPSFQEENSTRA
jgi:hypothetical protein